jgi:2-keto-4-pentenoate hydratase/2-oxohepta-3-ene-1,7-dioic acid hydratase in catechol pathway
LRIVRFVHDEAESYGVLAEDGKIIDVARIARLKNRPLPSNVDGLVSMGSEAERLLKGFVGALSDDGGGEVVLREEDVALKAPIIAPPKIVCLGLNYRDHAEEGGMAVPDEPVIFMKPRTTIVGPGEPVVKPGFVTQLDCEVELAIVIGKRGKNIPVSDAKDYIFGYTVFNDISARDIQFKDGQWTRGKSFDTFAPMGPCLTTGEQIGDPTDLRLSSRVNGETRQDSSTRLMIFDVYEIIHHLSRVMTLEPCDIIATGTPAGVAAFMKPEPKFLKRNDTVEVWVEKIGTLRNRIVAQE